MRNKKRKSSSRRGKPNDKHAGKHPGRQYEQGKNANTLRIIAGQWRGRKLSFATAPGLRPTPDRVREMLFNWLQGRLLDARGLDLFAGSGALGFEAVSRGLAHVTLVESHRMAAEQLQSNIGLLKTDQVECIHMDAFQFLEQQTRAFDIIFLDPPFGKNYLPTLIKTIHTQNLLAENGLLYIEHGVDESLDVFLASEANSPFNTMTLIKEKATGQVASKLFIKDTCTPTTRT